MVNIKYGSVESRALTWLRFPLALLVVLIHTAYTSNKSDFAFYLGKFFSENLASIAVPTFFFMSGYLFFAKYEKFGRKEYVTMLNKKSKTLLFPYLIWNLITYAYIVIWHLISDRTVGDIPPWDLYRIFWAVNDGHVATSLLGYKFSILCSPICGVLWFIRDLMVAMLLSPIIWLIVKNLRLWALVIFLVPWIMKIGIPVKGFGLMALCFFPLGGTFSICGKNLFKPIIKYGKYFVALFIVLLGVSTFLSFNRDVPGLLSYLMILSGLVFLFYIAYSRVDKFVDNTIIKLGETSFFIYVFHTCFVFNPLRFVIDPIGAIPYIGCTLAYVLSFATRVTVCVGVYYLMKRICPSILAILVGNRVQKK